MVFDAALNDLGEFALLGISNGNSAVFTRDGVVVRTFDVVDGKTLFTSPSNLSLNNRGMLSFIAFFQDMPLRRQGVFSLRIRSDADGDTRFLGAEGDTIHGRVVPPSLNSCRTS